jgi:alkane 1-monooxygenase
MVRALQYLLPISFFICAYFSFHQTGILAYCPLLLGFGLMPIAEILLKPNFLNHQDAEEAVLKESQLYDWVLYFFGFLQLFSLGYFFYVLNTQSTDTATFIGRSISMGVLCGLFGINLSHELGHRKEAFPKTLAKLCLSTSLFYHFHIEHNKGHHKNFCTPHDPASARKDENIYSFFARAIPGVYFGAWHIANDECMKKYGTLYSLRNEMIQAHILQGCIIAIAAILGWKVLVGFLIASILGMLLLESVDYIQHYGLSRKQTSETSYERGMPHHSWDSHYPIGRLMLFELTRHSDHHYLANRKYQILRSFDTAPQMPTGYPGTIILALVPPLWFSVMNKRIQQFEGKH